MRARITRDVPTDHPIFAVGPSNRAQRESFDQITMTDVLRTELDSMGYSSFNIEASRRVGSGEPKQYQFDVKLDGDVATFDTSSAGADFVGEAFNTTYEAVEDGEDFPEPEAEADDKPHSAVAAVGAIIAGDEGNGD